MKRLFIFVVAVALIFGLSGMAGATYTETLNVYSYSVGGTIDWNHTYDFSQPTPYDFVTLTIVADDVDLGEVDPVYFNGHLLGNLNDMGYWSNWGYSPGPGNSTSPDAITTTVFNIDPSWLDFTIPTSVNVATAWGVEIETSTLTVQSVPEPSTMLLLGSGLLAFVGFRRKFKS